MSCSLKVLGAACLALWLGILAFGLWPFDFFAKNDVQWLLNENGVRFDGYGEAYSTTPWSLSGESVIPTDNSLSLEIWLRSSETEYPDVSAILFIGDPSRPNNFEIAQSGSDLMVRGRFLDGTKRSSFGKLWLDDAFRSGVPRFITLTSRAEGTVLYLEGVPQKHYPLTLAKDSFLGPILLGHTPTGHQAWTGTLFGLAIYQTALTPDEVSEHYTQWQEANISKLSTKQGVAALYAFDERAGKVIHNRAGSAPALLIPARFSVLCPSVLSFDFTFGRSDLEDIVVNILGFVPFALLLCAYLQRAWHLGKLRSVLFTVFLGGITSLAIELLQVYLPSRESSLLDLIDNIVGTGLGAALYNNFASTARRPKVV